MLDNARVGFAIASSTLRRGNKKTTFFTIFVLTLIFVNLIFLPAMINGMTDIFSEAFIDYTGSIAIEPGEDRLYIENADSVVKKALSVSGVAGAAKRLNAGATLKYRGKQLGTTILGIEPEEERRVSAFHEIVKEGEYLTKLSRDEIMLGALMAGVEGGPEIYDNLGGIETGSIINATFSNGVTRQYKVKGIHEGGAELSDLVALVHYRELEEVLGLEGQDRASSVIIRTEKQGDEPGIKEKLFGLGVKERIQTWQEKVQDIVRQALESFNALTDISKIVSVIIAVFILFIIIYINTLNRKKQIGILKAVGITPGSIIMSYTLLSLFYTIVGIMLGGAILAVAVAYLQAHPINFYASMYLAPKVDPLAVVQAVASLLAAGFVAGLVPSWMVTREEILKAIWGR